MDILSVFGRKFQPNNFPMPPVIPPMMGMFPAGFPAEEEVFLKSKNIKSLEMEEKSKQLVKIYKIKTLVHHHQPRYIIPIFTLFRTKAQ